mgnify:FL=1
MFNFNFANVIINIINLIIIDEANCGENNAFGRLKKLQVAV